MNGTSPDETPNPDDAEAPAAEEHDEGHPEAVHEVDAEAEGVSPEPASTELEPEPEPEDLQTEDTQTEDTQTEDTQTEDTQTTAVGRKSPEPEPLERGIKVQGEAREIPEGAPTPIDPYFRILLPEFEGPLDLLLYLIRKHELDILDLPIAFIAQRYVDYISLMQELNLDVASEYLVMASTLAHIKSRQLLPPDPNEQEDDELEDDLDPRQELIRRLLEYQKYKKVAEDLSSRGVAGRDVFPRGIPAPKAEGDAPLAPFSVFKLIDAFQKIVKKKQGAVSLEVDAERISIQERINQITDQLRLEDQVPFEELFEGYATTYDLVVTFLALLEMAKMRLLAIAQENPDTGIVVKMKVLDIEPDVEGMDLSARMHEAEEASVVDAVFEGDEPAEGARGTADGVDDADISVATGEGPALDGGEGSHADHAGVPEPEEP